MYWSYRYHIFLHTCMMQCMRYMCMHVRSNLLCCPTFVDLTPKFGVHKYIYIHIQTQLKLNVLTFEKNICLFKIMKSKELSKNTKKNFQYIRKKNSRQNLFILTTAGDSWRLQAAPGAACDSWRLLATAGDSWRCLHPRCPSCS